MRILPSACSHTFRQNRPKRRPCSRSRLYHIPRPPIARIRHVFGVSSSASGLLRLLTSLLRRLHRQAADCFLRRPRSPHGKGRDSRKSPRRPRRLEEVFRVLWPPPPFALALSHS